MSGNNNAVAPIAVGTIKIKAKNNTDIHYLICCVHILKPVDGNIHFELNQIDYENNKLIYDFEYTGDQPAAGGPIDTYLLPVFMPHLAPDSTPSNVSYFNPTDIEVVNKADTGKKKTGKVSSTSTTHLDEPVEQDDTKLRVGLGLSSYTDSSGDTMTNYFLIMISKTTNAHSRLLSLSTSGSDINLEYASEQNPPEESQDRASIATLKSITNGKYHKATLGSTSKTLTKVVDGEHEYDISSISFYYPS